MHSDPIIQLYIEEVGRILPLSPECERKIALRLMRDDDALAREVLVLSNLRLVVRIAMGFTGKESERLHLLTEGNVGLLRAVEEYNPESNIPFSTSAVWWIKQTIRRAIHKPLPIPSGKDWVGRISQKWKTAHAQLESKLGRRVSLEELSRHLLVSIKRLQVLQNIDLLPRETFSSCGTAQSEMLGSILTNTRFQEPNMPSHDCNDLRPIRMLLAKLHQGDPAVLRQPLSLMTGQVMTFQEITGRFGVSAERVQEIEVEAMRRLTHFSAEYRCKASWYDILDD